MPAEDPSHGERGLMMIAEAQFGLLTSAQVAGAGLSTSDVHRRIRGGRWQRLGRGLFLVSGVPRSWEQRVMALSLATKGVASHLTAARLHRFGYLPRSSEAEVTVAPGRSSRSPLGRVHVARDASLMDVVRVGPVPVTDRARTMLDLGSGVGPGRHARILDDALDRGLVTFDEVAACLDRHRVRGRHGIVRLERMLGERGDGTVVTESPFERRFLRFCHEIGIPRPDTQVVLRRDGRPVARCDALFRSARLVVELDGRRGHRQLTDRSADLLRDQALLAMGWTTIRVTWAQLNRRPDALAETLRTLIGRDAGSHPGS